jgi:hypothetical protein
MTQADQIRQFVYKQRIVPARSAGLKEVTVRAGDIHKEMGLFSKMPSVCSVLDGRKLCDLAFLSITHRRGPPNGANVFITFNLETDQAPPSCATPSSTPRRASPLPAKQRGALNINPKTSLVLVSCVKSKLPRSVPAQDLYTSTLFTGCRTFARASGAPWFILSAKYGLVDPNEVIAPYEFTLNRLGVAARRVWAENVLAELLPKTKSRKTIVFLAGVRYREYLTTPLENMGLEVVVPMANLRFGEQLQWLTEHT